MIDPTVMQFFGAYGITTTYGAPAATTGAPHYAVDIGMPYGTAVDAPTPGQVVREFQDPIGGLQEQVRTPNGFIETFAHLLRFDVPVGAQVTPGEAIANSGDSGAVTGPHLHFGVNDPQGNPVDPLAFLKSYPSDGSSSPPAASGGVTPSTSPGATSPGLYLVLAAAVAFFVLVVV